MLYATTRNKTDTYTAYRTLCEDMAPDGGYFVPFRQMILEPPAVEKLTSQPFNTVVADVIELFFPGRITQWDVDCCIGKSAVNITAMSHRVLLAQLWNNPEGDVSFVFHSICDKLCKEASMSSDWAVLALKIALFFGIYSQLRQQGIEQFDVAVNSGNFNTPMAAWYARNMGLPIGNIICGCNENSTPWDFLHRGELNTGATFVSTVTKELDYAYPAGIERLIYETLGVDEVKRFLAVCKKRGVYQLGPDMLSILNRCMYASVIGNDRVVSVISSVYRSNQCILDPYTAVCYGSLQDYRSQTGESCPTVLLAEKSPLKFSAMLQQATGLADIRNIL